MLGGPDEGGGGVLADGAVPAAVAEGGVEADSAGSVPVRDMGGVGPTLFDEGGGGPGKVLLFEELLPPAREGEAVCARGGGAGTEGAGVSAPAYIERKVSKQDQMWYKRWSRQGLIPFCSPSASRPDHTRKRFPLPI